MIRLYFYTLSGIVSALIGWSLSQIFLLDLGKVMSEIPSLKDFLTNFPPEVILLPVVAACLAVAMVILEIFLSNPTRYKANWRILPPYFWAALGVGIVSGLLAAAFTGIVYASVQESQNIRVISWALIGLFTGLGESTSWRFRSLEGQTRKATQRIFVVTLFGLIAGFIAAVLVEIVRYQIKLGGYEEPVGFLILGLSLGVFLSFGTSPSYQAALRAGQGFEIYLGHSDDSPRLKSPLLRFVTEDTEDKEKLIEEGLSIQLPSKLKNPIFIGSDLSSHIYIPNIPRECASLTIKGRNFTIKCITENSISVNQDLKVRGEQTTLRHNQILTLYHENKTDKFYRFVFYDRFLDPEA